MSAFLNTWMAGVNETGRAFCGYAAAVLVQSGVLIAVLLLLDLVLRRHLRATLRYWIWMLVFIKLLLPPTFALPTGIGYWVGGYVARPASMAPVVPQTEEAYASVATSPQPEVVARTGALMTGRTNAEVPPDPVVPAESSAAQGERLTWQGGVLLLWSVGVLVLTAWVIRRLCFVRRLVAQACPAGGDLLDLLDQCRRRVGVRKQIAMKVPERSFSPAVCGLWRPTILIPAPLLTELSPGNLRAVLIHELAHIKRADLWVNGLQTALQIIYFYNPLIWLANAIVRRVREQAVDEMVLVALGAEAGSYSHTLIDIAEMTFLRASPALRLVGVAESKKSLEGRIKLMLTRPIPKSARLGLVGCLAVITTAAVLLPMAHAQNEPSLPLDSHSSVSQDENEAEAILKTADAYCQQKKYAEACGLYRHLLDKYPRADCAQTARGSLVLAVALLGDEGPLQTAIEGLLTSLPKDERLLQQVLDVAEKLRLRFQYRPARRLFQHVIDTWAQTQEADSARMCLVDVEVGLLVPTQDKAALQETIEKLVTQYQGNPFLPRTIDRIGDLCAHGKRYEEAEATYRRVIVLAGPDVERGADAQMAIAWLYYERAQYDEALREYTKVVQDYPKTKMTAGGQYWLGQCYLQQGDLDQAEKAYRETIELYPGDIYAGHAEKQLALVDRRREIVATQTQRREALQRTTNLRSAQVGQAQPPRAGRPASEVPAPLRPAPGSNLNASEYELRVAEIMQRFAAAIEKAYQDVGLTNQRVESLMSVQRQVPDETEEMKAYGRSWPAILQARQAAINEMASLGPGAVPALLRGRNNSGERRVGDVFFPAIAAMGAPAVPLVLEGLSKGDQPVRVRAITALRELRDPRAVEPLLQALTDSDRIIRISATQALGALADPRAADSLLALWSQQDDETRVQLASALGRLRDKRAIEPIAAALREWMATSRRTGVWEANRWSIYVNALRQIGDPRVIPVLEEVLQAGPQKTKSGSLLYVIADAAAQALRGLGCEVIGDREKGGYAVVRRSAAGAPDTQDQTAHLPGERPVALDQPAPGPAPSGDQYQTRVSEILQHFSRAVEKAYQDAGLTKPDVERLLSVQMSSETEKMRAYRETWAAVREARQAAIQTLASLGPGVVPVLLRARDDSGERRGGDLFVSALRMIGPSAVPAVIEGLASGDSSVRIRAANSLRELRDRRAVDPLIQALADSDGAVRRAVVGALGALADSRAADPLLVLWNQRDRNLRAELAWAWAATGDRRAVEPIMAALRECLVSAQLTGSWVDESYAMMRYAAALGQLQDARAIPVLQEALHAGPQKVKGGPGLYVVAEAAAGALRRFGYQVSGDREKGFQITEGPAQRSPSASAPQQIPRDGRDYEAAKTIPQSMAQWKTQEYGCGGNPRSWQALQADTKRSYPVTLVWPRLQEATTYVVHVKGLRGSRPARSYETTTNSLRLDRTDLAPGRYQWSVSVYDAQGTFLGDVETIDPAEVFAVADPQPAQANGKRVLIDLNHSAGNIAGWGWNNHGQYMTKELLESVGFAVDVNMRDLLTAERLRSIELLICHYYWTGWPNFRPYLESELTAVRQFVERGGSLLVVGCDGTDGRGKMTRAGNQLVQEFGLRFQWSEATAEDGWAQVLPQQNILSVDRRIQVQLPVGVEGEGSIPLLQFQGAPIARAKEFGKGRIIVAGVGMSFLDCYLGDFEYREPVHITMFYDFIQYLTGIDWKQTCERELLQIIQSRIRMTGAPH